MRLCSIWYLVQPLVFSPDRVDAEISCCRLFFTRLAQHWREFTERVPSSSRVTLLVLWSGSSSSCSCHFQVSHSFSSLFLSLEEDFTALSVSHSILVLTVWNTFYPNTFFHVFLHPLSLIILSCNSLSHFSHVLSSRFLSPRDLTVLSLSRMTSSQLPSNSSRRPKGFFIYSKSDEHDARETTTRNWRTSYTRVVSLFDSTSLSESLPGKQSITFSFGETSFFGNSVSRTDEIERYSHPAQKEIRLGCKRGFLWL